MLSRVAENIYWMSRYLERAASVARLLDVNFELALDLPGPTGPMWAPLVDVTGDRLLFNSIYGEPTMEQVTHFLTADMQYANSIVSCMVKARENARIVRDHLPMELWEEINALYHFVLQTAQNQTGAPSNPGAFYRHVKGSGMLLGGIAQDAMMEAELWRFFRAGRMLERADKTSRILDVKYFMLLPDIEYVGTPYDDIQWTALLRSLDGFQSYRRFYGRISPANVVRMLVLDSAFPRSIRYCLAEADHCLRGLTGSGPGVFVNATERVLGQVNAMLAYTEIDTIFLQGLHEFIDGLQARMNDVDAAIFETFFALFPAAPAGNGSVRRAS